MPVATKKQQIVGPFAITKLEGGEVSLRKMTWGEVLRREEVVVQASMSESSKDGQRSRMNVNWGIEAGRLFDFKTCIIDHNLTNDAGVKLDLGDTEVFRALDPEIGQEIADLIDKVNAGNDLAPFLVRSRMSSSANGKEAATS